MRFPEQQHHGALLSDSSVDAQRDFVLDDSLVIRVFQKVRLAGHFQLPLQRGPLALGGRLDDLTIYGVFVVIVDVRHSRGVGRNPRRARDR